MSRGPASSIVVRRSSPYFFASSLDLFRDELLHLRVAAEQRLQVLALDLELLQLVLDLDAFEARELPQPDLEDVLGLHRRSA